MQRQRLVWLASLAVSLMLVLSGTVWAATSGKIVGTVYDAQTGEPLPGANVVVEGLRMGGVTDVNGRYFILNVPAGTHSLRAVLVGYAPMVVKDATIRVDLTTTQDFRLEQQTIEITGMTVTAERPLVQRDVTTSRTLISAEELTQKPVDNIQAAVAQTAGAVATFDGVYIRGGRSGTGEVAYYVDGIDLRSPMGLGAAGTTDLATTIPKFAVENIEVMRGSYTAEYGNAQSAVITVITPEGGAKHAGTIYVKAGPEFLGLRDSQADWIDGKRDNLLAWNNALATDSGFTSGDGSPMDTTIHKAPILNTADGVDLQRYNNRIAEVSIGGPNPFSASVFPLSTFNAGNYFLSAIMNRRDGRWRGQTAEDWAVRGKFTFRSPDGAKKFSLTLHKQEATFDGAGFFISGDDGTTEEDYNFFVTTGDTVWLGPDGRPWWIEPAKYGDADVPFVVIDSLEGPNGEKVAVRNFDTRQNWAGVSGEHSNEMSVRFAHNISQKTYYELKLSRFETGDYDGDVDPYERYVNGRTVRMTRKTQLDDRFFRSSIPNLSQHYLVSPNSIGGLIRENNQVNYTAKFDIESQFSEVHSGRRGFEFRYYDLHRASAQPVSGGQVYYDNIDVNPIQWAGYVAEKFETQGMVLNIGARVDYLATRAFIPGDLEEPVDLAKQLPVEQSQGGYTKMPGWIRDPQPSNDQWYWSPRIGVSYPISASAKMHFSYGHFYQFPMMYRYYYNMWRSFDGGWKYAGNPNLGPEKTILYEVGFEKHFNNVIYTSLTGFYKDIDGLVDMQEFGTSVSTRYKYYMYVNSGYGNTRGFEFTLQNARFLGFQGNAAYTFMIARGRGGNTRQGFLVSFNNQVPRTEDYPLEWDQRHTLQLTLDYRTPVEWGMVAGGWGVNGQYTFGSGIPYSSSARGINPPINDKRYPSTWNLDLLFSKDVALSADTRFKAFVEVLNALDRINVLKVQNPERLEMSLREIRDGVDYSKNGIVENKPAYGGAFADPTSWSAGRTVRMGVQLDF